MWSNRGHARRERLTGGVWIVRGQSVRISIREQQLGIAVGARHELRRRVGQRVSGRDIERGREQRIERGSELSHVDQLTGRFVGLERRSERHDEHLGGHVHVERVVVTGLDLVDVGRDRRPRFLV